MMKSKVGNFFVSFLLLFLLWIGFIIIELIAKNSDSEAQIKIPQNTETCIVINPSDVLKSSIYQLLNNPDYQSTYELIKKNAQNTRSGDVDLDFGIDFTNPILLVQQKASENFYLLLHLSNKRNFLKGLKNNKINGFIKDNYGIVFFRESPKINGFSTLKYDPSKEITYIQQGKNVLSVDIQDDVVSFSGEISYQAKELLHFKPSQNHFFIQTPIAFKNIINQFNFSDEINAFLSKINQISINFDGFSIENDTFLPKMDAIFSVTDSLSEIEIQNVFNRIPNIKWHETIPNQYEIQIKNSKYSLKQLKDNEWFLGKNESNVTLNNQQIVFAFQGTPSDLLKIEGRSLLMLGLIFIPGYAPTKEYLSKYESCDVIAYQKDQKMIVSGQMKMKSHHNFLLEAINYGIRLRTTMADKISMNDKK